MTHNGQKSLKLLKNGVGSKEEVHRWNDLGQKPYPRKLKSLGMNNKEGPLA